MFSQWQTERASKDPSVEQRSFEVDLQNVQTLENGIISGCGELKFLADKIFSRSCEG